MACVSGEYHTITLSEDGIAYSFGQNNFGQLGFGHYNSYIAYPSPILNLPKIQQIACGWSFTVCIDMEGFVWSFGQNNRGQLGTGNTTNFNIPQKIENIPPVHSVSCGISHTLIITIDSELWSCGNNDFGQLCLGNQENQQSWLKLDFLSPPESMFQKTAFANILSVSCGGYHTIFQDYKGEIYACGNNDNGQLGLGHFNNQTTPILIPNLPSNIIQIVCGGNHNLFLDSDGDVFFIEGNQFSGIQNTNRHGVNQITNIPPIQTISCIFHSSYLLDMEGNVWSFGNNRFGQLGLGDTTNRNDPTKIEGLKDIQQISHGPYGYHFLAKDSQNRIFASGNNPFGQLGTADTDSVCTPKELYSKYFSIWGGKVLKSTAKSARK